MSTSVWEAPPCRWPPSINARSRWSSCFLKMVEANILIQNLIVHLLFPLEKHSWGGDFKIISHLEIIWKLFSNMTSDCNDRRDLFFWIERGWVEFTNWYLGIANLVNYPFLYLIWVLLLILILYLMRDDWLCLPIIYVGELKTLVETGK